MGIRTTKLKTSSAEKPSRRRSSSRHRDINHHYAPNCAHPHNDDPQVPLTIKIVDDDEVPKDCFGRELKLAAPRDCLGRRPSSRQYTLIGDSKSSGKRTKSRSSAPRKKEKWDVSSIACLADMHLLDAGRQRESMHRGSW